MAPTLSVRRWCATRAFAALVCLFGATLRGADFLGFAVSKATIPTEEILRGGPPRDGIPSLDRPKFIQPDEARFMRSGDLVVSLQVGEETRAYPLRILVWHEIVNDTGFVRDYASSPYTDYENSAQIMFPVPRHRKELPSKEWVAGLVVAGVPKAYPLSRLPKRAEFDDRVGDVALRIAYDPSTRHLAVTRADTGEPVPHTYAYWFAWQAFYPRTELWERE